MGCSLIAVAAVGCSSGDDIEMDGMGQGGTSAVPTVTFTKDIHPIFVMNCGKSGCHDTAGGFLPGHGDPNVDDAYQEVLRTGSLNVPIYEAILTRTASTDPMFVMPPNYATPVPCNGGLGTPGCLTQEQYDLIKSWVDQGHPK